MERKILAVSRRKKRKERNEGKGWRELEECEKRAHVEGARPVMAKVALLGQGPVENAFFRSIGGS